jgi:acetyl esterase/lipase
MIRGWLPSLCIVGASIVGEAAAAQPKSSQEFVFEAPVSSAQASRKSTFTYKKVGNLEIQADVYRPADDRPRPVVVNIHGGALMGGTREAVGFWAEKLVGKGYVLVSIDYRLAPETKLAELITDVEDAFRWIRERGPELFHADPERLAVMGASAGGYLSLVCGYRITPRPKALVALYGYGDILGDWYTQPSQHERHNRVKVSRDEAYRQASGPPVSDSSQRSRKDFNFYNFCRQNGVWPKEVSGWDPKTQAEKFVPYMPIKNVTAAYPPTLLIHGTADTDVPYYESAQMDVELTKHHVEHKLMTIQGAEHGLGADPRTIEEIQQAVVAFIQEHVPSR